MIKYKTKEVLEKVGISQASLYRYIKRGLIEKPIKTFNGRIYFTDKHINDLNTLLKGEKVIEEELPKATKIIEEEREEEKIEQPTSKALLKNKGKVKAPMKHTKPSSRISREDMYK